MARRMLPCLSLRGRYASTWVTLQQLYRFVPAGGYVVADPPGARVTLVATGSELATAQGAAALLLQKGIAARLVSVPCLACFEAQPEAWRREVIPAGQRVAVVEAGRGIEWWKLAGSNGLVIGIDRFGTSAPEKALAEEYGLTPSKVAARIEGWLSA